LIKFILQFVTKKTLLDVIKKGMQMTAAELANLLEGLSFPAPKEDVKNHLNSRSPSMGNRVNDVFERVQNNLEEGKKYADVYEIELAVGLVKNNET
jgi:hypothetical protein